MVFLNRILLNKYQFLDKNDITHNVDGYKIYSEIIIIKHPFIAHLFNWCLEQHFLIKFYINIS